MRVVKDHETGGLLMIPLFTQHGLTRCNVKDCAEKHTTVILDLIDRPFALCDKHYTEFRDADQIKCTLEF